MLTSFFGQPLSLQKMSASGVTKAVRDSLAEAGRSCSDAILPGSESWDGVEISGVPVGRRSSLRSPLCATSEDIKGAAAK